MVRVCMPPGCFCDCLTLRNKQQPRPAIKPVTRVEFLDALSTHSRSLHRTWYAAVASIVNSALRGEKNDKNEQSGSGGWSKIRRKHWCRDKINIKTTKFYFRAFGAWSSSHFSTQATRCTSSWLRTALVCATVNMCACSLPPHSSSLSLSSYN